MAAIKSMALETSTSWAPGDTVLGLLFSCSLKLGRLSKQDLFSVVQTNLIQVTISVDVWRPFDLDDFSNRRLIWGGGTLDTFLLILEMSGV